MRLSVVAIKLDGAPFSATIYNASPILVANGSCLLPSSAGEGVKMQQNREEAKFIQSYIGTH